MKSKFINVLLFAAGAAVGSAVTWKIVKNRYERIVQEEIESIKEAFTPEDGMCCPEEDDNSEDDESDAGRFLGVTHIDWSKLEDLDEEDDDSDDLNEYSTLASNYTSEKGGAEGMVKPPYVISPYDFGELDDYSQFELTYYADDVLEDEDYEIVKDRDDLIGPKALFTFGEYEEDSVFVRNERLKADFQILKDPRTYAEVRGLSPSQVD